jgi:hypothetical protein
MQRTHTREYDHPRSGHVLLRHDDLPCQGVGQHLTKAELLQGTWVALFCPDGALEFPSVVEIVE